MVTLDPGEGRWPPYDRQVMRRLAISPALYRRITFIALVMVSVIIVSGAAVQVTGSGLGCPDWPTCTQDSLVAPVSFHPLIEFVNRVFTGLLSVTVIVLVLGSLWRKPRRRDLVWLSVGVAFAHNPAYRRPDVEDRVRAALLARFGAAARPFARAVHRSEVLACVQDVEGLVAARLVSFSATGVVEDAQGRLPCPGPEASSTGFVPARRLSLDAAGILPFSELTP